MCLDFPDLRLRFDVSAPLSTCTVEGVTVILIFL